MVCTKLASSTDKATRTIARHFRIAFGFDLLLSHSPQPLCRAFRAILGRRARRGCVELIRVAEGVAWSGVLTLLGCAVVENDSK